MKRMILFLAFFICSSVNAQIIQIGTLSDNPPFEMEVDKQGNFNGFEIDLMKEICKRIAIQCQFVPFNYGQLLAKVYARDIELAIAAINITPERQKYFLFSLPYLPSYGQFITNSNSKIMTLDDVNGKKIGVLQGSVYVNFTLAHFQQVKIIQFPNLDDVIQSLINQQIDLAITDSAIIQFWIANNNSLLKAVGNKLPLGTGYGIVAPKNNIELIKNINNALQNMENDGTYVKIYNSYDLD